MKRLQGCDIVTMRMVMSKDTKTNTLNPLFRTMRIIELCQQPETRVCVCVSLLLLDCLLG